MFIIKQIIRAINAIVAELKLVIGAERLDVIGERPQIVALMISTYRHLRLVAGDSLSRAAQF